MSPLRDIGAAAVTAGILLLVLAPRRRTLAVRFVSRRVVDRDERDSAAAELSQVGEELGTLLDEGRRGGA